MVLVPLELREETEGGLLRGTAIKWSPNRTYPKEIYSLQKRPRWGLAGGRGRGEGVFKQVLRHSASYNACCLL